MFKISYDEIISKIKETGLSENEIEKKVESKLVQLSNLVSREGAAHIVANELGIKLYDLIKKEESKVNELKVGVRIGQIKVKLMQLYGIRGYQKGNREGRLCTALVGDETGITRLVIWDDKIIDLFEKGEISLGDSIKLINPYVRENNSNLEVHLGGQGNLEKLKEDINVSTTATLKIETGLKNIKELKDGDWTNIRGTIVQLFEPKFYDACPACNKKLTLLQGQYLCNEHGKVEPKNAIILNGFIDDSTENIRFVLFGEQAEKLLKESNRELLQTNFDSLRNNILGTYVEIEGRMRTNDMFERNEFTGRSIKELTSTELLTELEGKK